MVFHWHMKTMLAATLAALLCSCTLFAPITGNGKIVSGGAALTGFSSVSAGDGFSVALSPGEYDVAITTDENILPYVVLELEGEMLSIRLRPGFAYLPTLLEAAISLPDARSLEVSGGSSGALAADFIHSQGFTGIASGGSTLYFAGLEAPGVLVELSGGSGLSGVLHSSAAGTPGGLTMVLSGGSSVIDVEGSAGRLEYEHSGGGSSYLENLQAQTADVVLSGGSEVWLNATERILATLSGGSRLYYATYEAAPILDRGEISGGSYISSYRPGW